MIRAIALDDEPPALNVIKNFCRNADYILLEKTFFKADEAATYMAESPVDLLFLDINMPSISGLDFKKKLDPKTMVIFTTAYSEFALEGFNLNAVDYLLKPFTLERFLQATEKAKRYYQTIHPDTAARPDHILVRVDYSLVKIELSNIVFIEGLDDYLKIYLTSQKPLVVRMTMKAMIEKLPQTEFVRVHRSYIVPLRKIESVRSKTISIGDEEIPIGTSYEAGFFELYGKH